LASDRPGMPGRGTERRGSADVSLARSLAINWVLGAGGSKDGRGAIQIRNEKKDCKQLSRWVRIRRVYGWFNLGKVE
jgi:hypothetical protein